MNSLKSIAEELNKANSVLIFPHMNIDGDALGSSYALCDTLRAMGKTAYIVYKDVIPKHLDFLTETIISDSSNLNSVDVSIMVDCGSMDRLKGREEDFQRGKVKLCVDHHASVIEDVIWDYKYSEPDSAATAEIIYMLIEEMGMKPSASAGNALFTGISTDTGSFKHDNMTARTFNIVSKLFEVKGFSPSATAGLIYKRKSYELVKLTSLFLRNMKMFADNRLAIGVVTMDMFEESGCPIQDTEDLIDEIVAIDTVQIAATFKESPDIIRVSFRSKGDYDVAAVAKRFGGGGHIKASGCSIKADINEAVSMVTKVLIEEFK